MSEIFLDIETTGLSFREKHKIVEIACIDLHSIDYRKEGCIAHTKILQ